MKALTTLILTMFVVTFSIAQQKEVSGIVNDSSGLPLPGVNIVIKGSSEVTQTDFDGNYKILCKAGDILVFTYLGFVAKEVTVGKEDTINVNLEEDPESLDEVVVVAYGVSRRSSLTGSVAVISNRKPTKAQIKRQKQKALHSKIKSQLQGKITGINIKEKRKNTLKTNKQRLYIVDGVPVQSQYNSIVRNIDKDDIDHINVYKGAKAKSLFGSSARYGCVVITTKKGNYRLENQESYAHIDENKFERTKLSPLSTFSIDVDKASYSNVRRMINQGQKIPFDAVKIEEMINYFDYNYPQPAGEHPFTINTELAITPWNENTKLVRIGLQGKEYENNELPPSNLTFLIDVSGSMNSNNKLPLLKSAFKLLVKQLRKEDKVSIVVYAGAAGVVLEPTSGNKKDIIIDVLNNLQSGGSTAGGEGIKLAYKLAEKNFKKNGNNRVILATDGDFNVGPLSDKAMERLIEEKRKSGVFLSVLGFGYGNYKDSKLEILADKGNGNHAYIDNMQEAQKVFGKEFGGTLFTIAKDVKIQVEFNPNKVQAYRLIGYENRLLNDEDFIDDTKDAGELGSGHTVTALYEVIPVGVDSKFLKDVPSLKYTKSQFSENHSEELLTVKFRYKKPSEDKSIEMVHILTDNISETSEDMQFASSVALFGMHLRKSQYRNNTSYNDVIVLASNSRGEDSEGYRAEFIRLVKSIN
jgi:Ca-activated chloride channel family protein